MPISISGTNGVTLSGQFDSASSFGFKNRIINGAMMIDQRNAGASVTFNDETFPVDRFRGHCTQSSKLTAQRSTTAPTGFINSLLLTSSSAYTVGSGDIFILGQGIEGFNVADLGWGTASAATVTLSFWVRSSLTGTFGGALRNSAGNRAYPFTYTINSANTFEYKTVTIAGDTTGTWLTDNGVGIRLVFSLGAGSTYSGTAGAWAGSNFWSATGATSVVGTNGATFYITGVQLEKGSTATSFDYRPYGTEFQLCQRYLPAFRYDTSNTMIPSFFQFNSTTTGRGMIVFPVPTRTTVTGVTISSVSHFTTYDTSATSIVASAMGLAVGGTTGCLFDVNVASGATNTRNYILGITNSAGYMYFTGAEL